MRGGACTGETEAGGLEEFAGDSDGGGVTELCKEWTEVGEATRTSEARLPSTEGRRSLEILPAKDI